MSITSLPFRVVLASVALLTLAAAIAVWRRSRWLSSLVIVVALALIAGNGAAAINVHYDYLPNVESLWGGYHGRDQTSWRTVRRHRADVLARRSIRSRSSLPHRRAVAEPIATSDGPRPRRHLGGSALDRPGPPTPGDGEHGMLVRVAIPGVASGFHGRRAEVYLPPAWVRRPAVRLPVLLLLHGTPGTPEDWSRSAHADEVSDRWASKHDGQAPILVMPDVNGQFWKDSECTDGKEGRLDTYLSVDVPRWVEDNLAPSNDHRQWGVGGLSEGGLCALDLTLRHPDTFSLFLDYAGEDHLSHRGGALSLFEGTPALRHAQLLAYEPKAVIDHFARPRAVHGWFEVGSHDRSTLAQTEPLATRASRRGFDVRFRVRPGYGHSFAMWSQCLQDSYGWMAAILSTPTGAAPSSNRSPSTRRRHPTSAPSTGTTTPTSRPTTRSDTRSRAPVSRR